MDTTIYLRFHIKKSKINRKGRTPVMMRVTLNSRRSEINIGRSVEPDKWNAQTEKMMGRSIEANELNSFIELMREKVKAVQKSFVENEEDFTLAKFVKRFKGEEKDKSKMTLEVFKEHNEQMDRLSGKGISKSTAKRYWTCYNHVEQYIDEVYKAEDYRMK
ncbi:MAG: Arm DNA-binding domain-containing protein, partial [Salegentibacter sp.]